MKLGILTFHRALNYGAFLQAFSLLFFFKNKGYEVEIVDYWPKEHEQVYELFDKKTFFNKPISFKIKYILHFLLKYSRAKKRKEKIKKIQNKYLNLPSTIMYPTPGCLNKLSLDTLIYGSDQIWWKSTSLHSKTFDWTYWGDYVPKAINKISYAASMGVISISKNEKEVISHKLTNFKHISVREQSLKEILQTITPQKIHQTIDPVFLTSKETWLKFVKEPKISKKYLLLFNLQHSKETDETAIQIAKKLHIEIIEITASVEPLKFGKNIYQTLDAFEFIGFIKNAEFVVTSSFHGTAFSIIFEKQFISTGMGNNSDRVKTLLDSLKISNRLVTSSSSMPNSVIDYKDVNLNLKRYVTDSIKFIQNSLHAKQ